MREARPEDHAMVRRLARALLRSWSLTDTHAPVSDEVWEELSASHEALVASQMAPTLNIGLNKIDYGRRVVLDDTEEASHKGFARSLHRAGLRSIRIAGPALNPKEWRRLVETLTKNLGRADQIDRLVVDLWNLDFRQIELRAIDGPDDTTFAASAVTKTISREDFNEQFLYRVRQTFSPLVTEARIGAARRSLDGGVGCDSVSLESQFNLVFRRRGSSERLQNKGDESAVYEPGLIDRLTQALGVRASSNEDDELRALLREQLSRCPALTDDTTLLCHAAAVLLELESLQPPAITTQEATEAYAEIALAALASQDFERIAAVFTKLFSGPPRSSLKQLAKVLCAQDVIDRVLFAAAAQSEKASPETNRSDLSRILEAFSATRLAAMLSDFLRRVERPEAVFSSLQTTLQRLAQENPRSLIPILRLENESLSERAFELVSRCGAAAVPVLQGFMAESDERLQRLAARALRMASEASGEKDA